MSRAGIKVIVIGELKTGKTCLAKYFINGIPYTDKYEETIGADFFSKRINVTSVYIWDLAGAEKYRTLSGSYCRGSNLAIFVYDITNKDSFRKIPEFLEYLKTINDNKTVSLVLLGNKCDLEYKRRVSYEEGKEYADKNNMIFYETCALNGYNVLEGLHWGILGYHQNNIFLDGNKKQKKSKKDKTTKQSCELF